MSGAWLLNMKTQTGKVQTNLQAITYKLGRGVELKTTSETTPVGGQNRTWTFNVPDVKILLPSHIVSTLDSWCYQSKLIIVSKISKSEVWHLTTRELHPP